MAFPTILANGTWGDGGSAVTAHKVTCPSGVQAGDLLVVYWNAAGGAQGALDAKWTSLAGNSNGTTISARIAYAIADGTESSATLAFTTLSVAQRGGSVVRQYRNWGAVPVASTLSSGTSANPGTNSLSPTAGAQDYEWLSATFTNAAFARTRGPTNYSAAFSPGANGATRSEGFYRNLNAATENPGAWVFGGSVVWLGWTVAIQGAIVATLAETGASSDLLTISAVTDLSPGKLWIGRFVNTDPQYTIGDEILTHAQVTLGQQRPNIIAVDGEVDSWTEYDRADLVTRDVPVNKYLDLPELKNVGDVRQRAVEELDGVGNSNSPGGDVVWRPAYTRLDHIFWISEDNSKYETRIEGLTVAFDQSVQPFQRSTIDTGLMVFCPPDSAASYLVRDLFDRVTTDGLGTANIGGSWTTS